MRTRILTLLAAIALALSGLAAPLGILATRGAEAAVHKSLESGSGGAGNAAGAGDRLGQMLSGWGVPVITALAGCLLVGALATRNIGASVGIVVISLLALVFLLAPGAVETFAKGIASTVF